jgi:hypothetical protein
MAFRYFELISVLDMFAENSITRSMFLPRVLFLLVLVSLPQHAFSQSSKETTISITRGESVKISKIDDWLIGVYTAIDSINNIQYNWDWECVYSSTGTYGVRVESQNGGSQLTLKSAAGDTMRYWLYTYFRQGATYSLQGFTTPVINLSNLSGSQSLTCADEGFSGHNLFFAALVRPIHFNAAPPGIYQDLVTLTITPE